MGLKEIFTQIYNRGVWGGEESKSGKGSDSKRTEVLRAELVLLLRDYGVKHMIDASCGDFNWMREVVSVSGVGYLGLDIVEALVGSNNIKYANKTTRFEVCDITEETFPKADLVLCRDALVHLSYAHIRGFLNNFISSGSRYLLATTFNRVDRVNQDLVEQIRGWRLLNLEIPPFSFPKPVGIIDEQCEQIDSRSTYTDKSLGLWDRSQLVNLEFLRC